jgi:hypothetical protein
VQRDKNTSGQGPNLGGDQANKEYGGFLTSQVREGDILYIADAIVIIKQIKNGTAILVVRAPKDQVIKKTEAVDGK